MTETEPSLMSSILAYTGVYLALAILLNIILLAAEIFAGVVIESSAVGWMPPIIGAMQAGQRYGRLTGRKATNGYAWLVSFCFVVVSLVLSIGLIIGLTAFYGIEIWQIIDTGLADLAREGITLSIIAAILGGVALLLWILLRFGFNFGAGLAVKAAAAAAVKANQ